MVRGTVEEGHRVFSGIPYAAPPVGDLRWSPPQPADAWDGVLDATQPGSACPQGADRPTMVPSDEEDCLYLNVTTPADASESEDALPVMVWLHGNDFNGSAGEVYGAQRLAEQGGVVVVTVNYRLGTLGFLAHPALDADVSEEGSGNFGLQDQRAALEWVRGNAEAFGGDPDNITLFGESAGATGACAQMAVPGSESLFDKVILQSGLCTNPYGEHTDSAPRPRQVAEEQGVAVAEALGCPGETEETAACLREASVAEIAEAGEDGAGVGPVVGDGFLPTAPAEAFDQGLTAPVPTMVGITRDEYRMHAWGLELMNGGPLTEEDVAGLLAAFFPEDTEQVSDRYPTEEEDPVLALSAAMTDHLFAASAQTVAEAQSELAPTYVFEFADDPAPWFAGAEPPSYQPGAFHSADLPYLFEVGYAEGLDGEQTELSDRMIDYWANFARTGDPNGADLPEWTPFTADTPSVQGLASGPDGIGGVPFVEDHHTEFWNAR